MIPFIIQGDNITVVVDKKPYTISKGNIGFDKLKDAIKNKDWNSVPDLVNPKTIIKKYSNGQVTIENGNLIYNGAIIHNSLSKRIIDMFEEGFDIEPMVKFMINLDKNPSRRAVEELYNFMEKCNLPLTDDGHFLAYKKINKNYNDVHSNSVINKPVSKMSEYEQTLFPILGMGREKNVSAEIVNNQLVISMPRNKVDDISTNTCSTGLHFCSYDYLKSFSGERIVTLKINPADVVSIPVDYNFSKGRCSAYTVINEVESELHDDNVLSRTPLVFVKSPIVRQTVENAIKEMSISQRKELCARLTVWCDSPDHWYDVLDALLEKRTFRTIREELRIMGAW